MADVRLAALTAAYRGIDRRYEELEALSRREQELLERGADLPAVRELLDRKRSLLETIHGDEARLVEMKSRWSRVRRELPADETRELLRILDRISARIERALALESDCRSLLRRAAGFRPSGDAR